MIILDLNGKQDTGLVKLGDKMNTSIEHAIQHPSPVMCPLRKENHAKLLSQTIVDGVPGAIVECGSFTGEGSTQVLASVMHYYQTKKILHIYDSFQGLSELSEYDAEAKKYNVGKGSYSSPQGVLEQNLIHYNIQKQIHPGWFEDTLPTTLPETICYAHLDSDLYEPTLFCLHQIYNRLSDGAICIIDDYHWPSFPGVTKAVDEFIGSINENLHILPNTIHAFFKKGSKE